MGTGEEEKKTHTHRTTTTEPNKKIEYNEN